MNLTPNMEEVFLKQSTNYPNYLALLQLEKINSMQEEACIYVRIRRFKDMEKREMKCGVYYDCLLYTSLAIEIKEIPLIVFLTNIWNLQQGY